MWPGKESGSRILRIHRTEPDLRQRLVQRVAQIARPVVAPIAGHIERSDH
jgi:hypothetical protein